MTPPPLPIDARLPEIADLVRRHRAAVVVAPPGAGKTTRVPPALAAEGPVIVLQPRRIAARALARRIAEERGWALGDEVGWHVRFERRAGKRPRVLVATEGILTAYLQSDPLLSAFATVVLDEFHERSLHADLALALARQAWRARPGLRLVVMSATLDAEPVARFLDGAPIVRVEARAHPVAIEHAPRLSVVEGIEREWGATSGHLLAFVPGAPEIRRAVEELSRRPQLKEALVLPLHGLLPADEQDRALAPASKRKVIVATNVAETSLTIDGVTSVVDSGFHRLTRFDPAVGFDRLETERISRDAADQRAGRAGRTRPGRALRLWDARDILRDHREPEIARVDLAAPVLEVIAWGGDPRRFEWLEAPPADRVDAALALLAALGAVDGVTLTPLGDTLRRLPVPPRLARVLVAAGGSPLAAACCAVLFERWAPAGPLPATDSDLIARADRLGEAPARVRAAAEEIHHRGREIVGDLDRSRAAGGSSSAASHAPDVHASPVQRESGPKSRPLNVLADGAPSPDHNLAATVGRAFLAGFPDRLARRRSDRSPRLILAGGGGAVLDRNSVVHEGELLLALDVDAGARGPGSEARVRIASRVERAWLPDPRRRIEHRFDPGTRSVRALEISSVGGLVLDERPVPADPAEAGPILAAELMRRGLLEGDPSLRARLAFAGIAIDEGEIARRACVGRTSLPEGSPLGLLGPEVRRALDRDAPAELPLPSGRRARLEYREDGSVVASVKLQELFGLADTPRLGRAARPVIFAMLAPNGRPVQTTSDLRSFWDRTYPEVRRELRGRYPKHPWPEDPWTAPPTHRAGGRKTRTY